MSARQMEEAARRAVEEMQATRRNCEGYGTSRRRWVWAVGLLKLARVLGDQVASADTFLIEDVGECGVASKSAR